MRFGAADEEDHSETSSIYSALSDESDYDVPPRYSEPVSGLGRKIHDFVTSSDSESESEDDFEYIGGLPRVRGLTGASSSGSSKLPKSETLWRNGQSLDSRSKGKARASVAAWEEDGPEPTKAVMEFMRFTEEQAMREGRKSASDRKARLLAIHQSARQAITQGQKDKMSREDAEMADLLQGLVIQQERKEKELAEKFAARERKLWDDIDAAINGAEKREADARTAELAKIKKREEDEEVKAAAATKEAQARRAAAEKMARDQLEKDRVAAEAKKQKEQVSAAEKARLEEKQAAAAKRGQTSTEWKSWVDKQKWMKTEVIDVIKADSNTRTTLRTSMRLMTRNLGQVTNAKETVLRVTNSIHKELIGQLPSEPSAASPIVLDSSTPKTYAYLLSHLAKALIKQAESEVSAKTEAAFPLARVVIGLMLRGHAALSDVLFARFVKKCPWVVPFYPSKQPDQSREAYEKSTGRGSDESITDYIARMGGITSLYFAILQTPLSSLVPTLPTKPTPAQLPTLFSGPLRFPASWTWLANALRDPMAGMQPIAHLVTAWIEILGREAILRFGEKQLEKVLTAMYTEGIEGGKVKGDGEAARERLSLVLQEWKAGGLQYPKGRNWE